MFQLVACFLLLNFAQMADEMMHMMSLVLRHQFLRHQATLLIVEHRRRRTCKVLVMTENLSKLTILSLVRIGPYLTNEFFDL